MISMKKNKKGFTLVELLAVIVVLIIVMLIALNVIRTYTKDSKEKAVQANALGYIKAVDAFIDENTDTYEFQYGIFKTQELDESGVKLSGTKPDDGYVIGSRFNIQSACLEYGSKYLMYTKDGVQKSKKGHCSTLPEMEHDYEYTGNYETFTVPFDGYYKIELWGAASGAHWKDSSTGSGGGYASGVIKLNTGDKLYFYVGQQGTHGSGSSPWSGPSASFNGGGYGGNSGSGSGGGATDVRLVSGAWDNQSSLASRIIVAGGGGGADDNPSATNDGRGGGGGGLSGVSAWISGGYNTGYQGTQTTGYAFGKGANCEAGTDTGGAGGGYFGGKVTNHGNGGAGGRSGYVSGFTGCVAIKSQNDLSPRLDSENNQCADGTTDNLCSIHYSGKKFLDPILRSANQTMPSYESGEDIVGGNPDGGHAKIYFLGGTY